MVIGIGVQTWGTDVAALRRYWRAADDHGYARVTYGDGLWGFTHDGWAMLGALAALTGRARIGPAVTYAFDPVAHHPSWLAKRAVAVDHLSGGRLDLRLGVGAGDESAAAIWRSHGIEYPTAGERLARLDETVALVRSLWTGAPVTHAGRMGRLVNARIEPLPVQRPGPPIWIAAMRPRALRLTARRADGWEASYVTPHAFGEAWRELSRDLAAAGRSPESLRRSVELDVSLTEDVDAALGAFCAARKISREHPLTATLLAGGADLVAARLAEYAAAGVTDVMLGFTDFPSTRMLQAFARDVAPRLAAVIRSRSATPPAV